MQHIRDAADRGIVGLPGFEANSAEGIHVLVIFEADTSPADPRESPGVARNSGVFPKWGKEALVIQSDLRRTGRSLTREIGITRSTGTWGPLTEKALKYFLSRDEARMYSTPLESQTQALNVLNQQMLLAEEYQAAKTLTSTTVITNNVTLTSGSQFNDSAADPIKTIVTGIRAVEDASFVSPNTIVFSRKAWNALLEHPSIVDRFKYVQASIIGKAEIQVATRRTWYAWSGDPVPRFWRPGTGPWVRRAGTVAVSVTPSSR